MKALSSVLTCAALFGYCSAAVEPDFFATAETVTVSASSGPVTFGYIIQLIFSLAVVFGLIFVAAKYLIPKFSASTKGRFIQVEDKVVLEPQVTSYIIKVGDLSWLIVVSNKHIAKIDRIDGKL